MSEKLKKIDEKAQYVEVYNELLATIESFQRLAVNIPKVLNEVTQHMYGRFDSALYNIFAASNTFDKEEKLLYLNKAVNDIFFQYTSLELLVKTRAFTVGAANTIIINLSKTYNQLKKWQTSVRKS